MLPTSLDKEEVLLLTVNLSSNGEIALHSSRSSSKTSAETGEGPVMGGDDGDGSVGGERVNVCGETGEGPVTV